MWVLIIATFGGGIATAEFTTRERCETAIVAARGSVRDTFIVTGSIRWAICVER